MEGNNKLEPIKNKEVEQCKISLIERDHDIGWCLEPFGALDPRSAHDMYLCDMFSPHLEKGKVYEISYRLHGNNANVNIIPQSGEEFSIDSISCVDVTKALEPKKVHVPKGMSPSYFHLLNKKRKKKPLF